MSLPTPSTKIPNQKVVPILVRIETYVNRYGEEINKKSEKKANGRKMHLSGRK
jgi:hypothetical protein